MAAIWGGQRYDPPVEKELVKHCDKTICVAAPLVEKMTALAPGRQVELVPNAVERDFLPLDYQHKPVEPPIVGYFGHLSDAWFDWKSFIEIAEQRPQLTFEVIGHSAPQGLNLPSNIKMLGPKPWHELHHYAYRWKVGIIPFRMGRLADGVDPIKIYEYLSFRLPVVSFRMPQIDNYPYTTTVESIPDFCLALDAAITMTVESSEIEKFIKNNTWEKRAEQLINIAQKRAI